MRHKKVSRRFSRTSSHRMAMMRNLAISLIEHEIIKTTVEKAKELIEELPDKDSLRKALSEDPTTAPVEAQLVQKVSLTYNLRKRLKTGI